MGGLELVLNSPMREQESAAEARAVARFQEELAQEELAQEPQPEPQLQPQLVAELQLGLSYELGLSHLMANAPGSTDSQFCELRRENFDSDATVDVDGVNPLSSAGTPGQSPFHPKGCDWVTYASPHFDSRHELVQSMKLESLQDKARLSLHLDVPERVGGEELGAITRSEQPANCLSKAPGSAPANMSNEDGIHTSGGDPAFGTSHSAIFGAARPTSYSFWQGFRRSRVTVEAVRAPRTRVNTRCLSIGCPKTYTEYKLRLELRNPEEYSALVMPDPFCRYTIATRYRQVRDIHRQLSRIIPVSSHSTR